MRAPENSKNRFVNSNYDLKGVFAKKEKRYWMNPN